MSEIRFRKLKRKSLIISKDDNRTLMKILLDHQIPVASSCNGDGVCGKCRIEVINGNHNLNPENEIEIFLKEKNQCKKNERISCQIKVCGDIEIDTGYW